jgi:hypothetical protein
MGSNPTGKKKGKTVLSARRVIWAGMRKQGDMGRNIHQLDKGG